MSEHVLYAVLILLALGLALNLKLTFFLLATIRDQDTKQPLVVGEKVPDIAGRYLSTKRPGRFPETGKPAVFLFLMSACPKCRSKLPEVASMVPALENAGLDMWIVSTESRRKLLRFLQEQPALESMTVQVGARAMTAVNPTISSPSYLFIDEEGMLQARGMIGDDDWLAFTGQMKEIQEELLCA
jgi:hypothetical protein